MHTCLLLLLCIAFLWTTPILARDPNYSEPARLMPRVVPPWYLNPWIGLPAGAGAILLLLAAIGFHRYRNLARTSAEQH